MRWSGWRAKAPFKDSVSPRVLAVVDAALSGLGADPDPECWVVWGDDPRSRYMLLVPTASGLVQVNVRVAVPGEGPRAGGKVVRWQRVQLGELAVEIQGGHRLVTFQVEAQVLNGADATPMRSRPSPRAVRRGRWPGRPVTAKARAAKSRAGKTAVGTKARRTGPATGRPAADLPPRKDRPPDRGRHLRSRRRDRRLRDLVGRGPSDFAAAHGRTWTGDDRAAVMGANSAGGRGRCASGWTRPA